MIEIAFDPLVQNPHLQTLIGYFHFARSEPPSAEKKIHLQDGDQLSHQITTPKTWKPTDPTVVLVHGLCGSHRSPYIVRMAKRLLQLGVRTVRMNMRGCGSGIGLAKHFYHAGRSEDLRATLQALKEDHPQSPILVIGYSLGANVVLKMAGEGSHEASQVIAVSPPADLYTCVQQFSLPQNAFYERRFSQILSKYVTDHHAQFGTGPAPSIPKNLKLFDFDSLFTAPLNGFTSAYDYYAKCSSAPLISNISVPCKILFAKDDPLVPHSSLDSATLPPNVQIYKTRHGGHLGFLGNPLKKTAYRWLDSFLISLILKQI